MESGTPLTLRDSTRRVASTLLNIGQTRLELAATELEEERLYLAQQVLTAALAMFFIGLGLLLGCAWAIWAAPAEHRLLVLGLLSLACVACGALLAWRMQRAAQARPPLLNATLTELQKDAAALRGSTAS